MGSCVIPIAEPEFTKVRINENPLLKVPPASRGNRTRARFPPLREGNLQEGGNCKLRPRDWYNTNRAVKVHKLLRMQNPPTPCPLPHLSRGERVGVRGDSKPTDL